MENEGDERNAVTFMANRLHGLTSNAAKFSFTSD